LYGRPDFVFRSNRVVIFVDGFFWHGHPKLGHLPKTNREFWRKKIERNRRRDREVNNYLRERGWTVVRIWEHELARRNEARVVRRLRRILAIAA
jgi:DNA mismatch endonuclease, patch repair protein